jgi:hypothetical protein
MKLRNVWRFGALELRRGELELLYKMYLTKYIRYLPRFKPHRMQASAAEPVLKSATFDVGGVAYSLLISDIEKFPGSFFETAIKKEWLLTESTIKVQRDGLLFRYVYAFLVSGALPRTKGKLALSADEITALKQEADFFNLPSMLEEFERPEGPDDELVKYHTIRYFVDRLKERESDRTGSGIECEYLTNDHAPTDLVFLLGDIKSPFCVQNKLTFGWNCAEQTAELFKSSTLGALNIPELLAECEQSAFGRGTETVFDPAVRNSFEIPASKLNLSTLKSLAGEMRGRCYWMAANMDLKLRPYKLVIYQEGGHFDAHRDPLRGDGHIGTAVLVLNSEYTGGELEITHNGHTEVVTGSYSWVAMYGDCLHKINPVTSGTRVSLIFDLYATPSEVEDCEFWGSGVTSGSVVNVLGCTETNRAAILSGVEKELAEYDVLIICLAHKYPLSQATPDFLKGSDLSLYELLKDTYDAQVVACAVNTTYYEDCRDEREVVASLFSSFDSPPAKAKKSDSDPQPAVKKAKAERSKFLIPAPLNADSVLDYSPYIEHTGNEAQAGTAVYLVSGLQLRKRSL